MPTAYLRRRILDECLPWDHLDSGVSKTFLQRELAAAFARTLTPDCSIERCTYCGACDFASVRNVTYHPHGAKGSENRGAEVDSWARAALPDSVAWPTQNWARLVDRGRPASHPPAATAGAPSESVPEADDEANRPGRRNGLSHPPSGEACTDPPGIGYQGGEGNAEEWLGTDRQALAPGVDAAATSAAVRIRLTYQKLERARFLGNRELTTVFVRAARRAGLPLAFSQGHHPLPRMSFGPALSLGVASLAEFMDLDLTELRSPDDVVAALNEQLPDGLVVLDAEALPLSASSIDYMLRGFSYRVSLEHLPPGRVTAEDVDARLAAFESALRLPRAQIQSRRRARP